MAEPPVNCPQKPSKLGHSQARALSLESLSKPLEENGDSSPTAQKRPNCQGICQGTGVAQQYSGTTYKIPDVGLPEQMTRRCLSPKGAWWWAGKELGC